MGMNPRKVSKKNRFKERVQQKYQSLAVYIVARITGYQNVKTLVRIKKRNYLLNIRPSVKNFGPRDSKRVRLKLKRKWQKSMAY